MMTVDDMVRKVTTIHKETGTHPTSVTMSEQDYRDMCRSHAQDILDCNTVVERVLYNMPRRLVTDNEANSARQKYGKGGHYVHYETIADMMYQHWQATGEQFRAWLLPQLVGYEGKTLEVVDKWGDTQRFKLGTTGIWALQHSKVIL